MYDILLEELQPAQRKKAVAIIGRFSPPHLGHYKAIDRAKAFIRKNPDLNLEAMPVVVVVAGEKTSLDLQTNPLSPQDRIDFMRYSGRADGVKFSTAKNAFSAFAAVRELGFEPIAIAAGDDRAKHYLEMLDTGFTNDDGSKIKHYIVPGLERTEANISNLTDESTIDTAAVSGTMVRAAIDADYEDVFTRMVGLEKKPKLAALMFSKIKKAMNQ